MQKLKTDWLNKSRSTHDSHSKDTKKTGTFEGKSNKLGHGGRADQLRVKGVPEGVIGWIARKKEAAPGQKNYHGKRGK